MMPDTQSKPTLAAIIRREFRELVTINPSDRPWELPFAVSMAAGLPMVLGAWYGAISYGALASIGAMAIVYLPRTRLDHRLATLMAAAFAMIACYALGQVSQLVPVARGPIIAVVAVLVTMACRYYRVVPPAALFFVMAAAIGAYAPGVITDVPMKLGVFALGSIGAVVIGFAYSAHILRFRDPLPNVPPPDDLLDEVVIEPLLIGLFVGLSLATAQVLALDKPYWVPISCLAVIQGVTLRAVWNRQVHRIVGTIIGLGLTWLLVSFAADPWAIAAAVIVLTFCIETAIVRHYAFAAIFITPMTILLAEASTLGQSSSSALINARLVDTVIGCLFGLVGGICIHNASLRRLIRRMLRAGS